MRVIDPYKGKSDPYCTSYCKFFRCGKRALIIRGDKRVCGLTGDDCDPIKCIYASCIINRYIAPNGMCGLTIKRRTRDVMPSKVMDVSKDRVKGKIKKDKDIFY